MLGCIKKTFIQGQQLKARLVNDVNEGLSFHKNIDYANRESDSRHKHISQRIGERSSENNYYSIDRKLPDRSNDLRLMCLDNNTSNNFDSNRVVVSKGKKLD